MTPQAVALQSAGATATAAGSLARFIPFEEPPFTAPRDAAG
ncbi:hypothetical protein PKCBPO_00484 [Methylorubrum thiocyanatum]